MKHDYSGPPYNQQLIRIMKEGVRAHKNIKQKPLLGVKILISEHFSCL